jgi:hypothetical protein
MTKVFLGSEAVAAGLSPHELRRRHQRLFRDVYAPNAEPITLRDRIAAAWLRSGRRGVIAGVAASALHGASWVADDIPVEMIWSNTRPPTGIIARAERVAPDEITRARGLPVTTRARTAFDLARHLPRDQAVARLDALLWVSHIPRQDIMQIAERYPGTRGLRRLRCALALADGGAASPQETRLRLLFADAGLPRPATQLPVVGAHGRLIRMLDMAWEKYLVAAEYDGDQHRTDRRQYVKDLRVMPVLQGMGWDVIRVVREDHDREVVDRARSALMSRGWRP